MIVTKQQLQRMIDEEFERALKTRDNQKLDEAGRKRISSDEALNKIAYWLAGYDADGGLDSEATHAIVDILAQAGVHVQTSDEYMADESVQEGEEDTLDEKTPPGGEKVVRALKHQKGVKNPWAVAWSMKNRGEI